MNTARIIVLVSILIGCESNVVHAAASHDAYRVVQYVGAGSFLGATSGFVVGVTAGNITELRMPALLHGLVGGATGAFVGGIAGWRYGLYRVFGTR